MHASTGTREDRGVAQVDVLRGDALDGHWGSVAWSVARDAPSSCQGEREGCRETSRASGPVCMSNSEKRGVR
jgi:hypothetical protein